MAMKSFMSSPSKSGVLNLNSEAFEIDTAFSSNSKLQESILMTTTESCRLQQLQDQSCLNEILRLRKDLEEMTMEKEMAEEMVIAMAQDLALAQEEARLKTEELIKKDQELLRCREDLNIWKDKAQNPSMEIRKQKKLTAKFTKSNEIQELDLSSETTNVQHMGEELVRLREQVADLTALLAKNADSNSKIERDHMKLRELFNQSQTSNLRSLPKAVVRQSLLKEREDHLKIRKSDRRKFETNLKQTEERLNAQLVQEQDQRRIAEVSLQKAEEEFDVKMKKLVKVASLKIEQLEKQLKTAHASLQTHEDRIEAEKNQEQVEKNRIKSLEEELQDQRKLFDWFKENSEQLSKDIKETQAIVRGLEQSEYALRRQIADLETQITMLQVKLGLEEMPGSFPTGIQM